MPADYRTFLPQNGLEHNFVGNYACVGLSQVVSNWELMTGLLRDGTFDDGRVERSMRDGFNNWDDGRLQQVWWSPRWVPVAEDSAGNLVCLDGDPGPKGVSHQVIKMEVQGGQGPFWAEIDSFTEYLQSYCDRLNDGEYQVEDGWLIEID